MGDTITIRKLIDRISSGDIRIPAFQRDFVWEPDQVAFLLDSIYKSFPIGTVILWKTDSRLSSEKRLGAFVLPDPKKDYPVNYVLDGQQRLTSLFSVFQTELKPEANNWTDVYFDMQAPVTAQESVFVALDDSEVDPRRHFPVKTLFDTVEYRKATTSLSKDQIVKIDDLQSKFKEYLIPNEVFESDDREKVAIVFERINRAGTPLDVFELLSAWSWSDEFDLVEEFKALQHDIAEHGFEDLCENKSLQMRTCAAVIAGQATPKTILDLRGDEIRARFFEIKNGILGALDFLKREAGVEHYRLLPYPGLLVPLSCFFATDRTEGLPYSDSQRTTLLQWFWRALFTRRFSSDVNQRQEDDIAEMKELRRNPRHRFKLPSPAIKFDFGRDTFSGANANSRVHILLLNSMSPLSFLSGAKIDLSKVLKKSSKHEYHHVFPQKHLERLGKKRGEINVLANICFLTRADNNKIRDRAPSEYLLDVEPLRKAEYLAKALCPRNFDQLTYEKFIEERAALLVARARELMG